MLQFHSMRKFFLFFFFFCSLRNRQSTIPMNIPAEFSERWKDREREKLFFFFFHSQIQKLLYRKDVVIDILVPIDGLKVKIVVRNKSEMVAFIFLFTHVSTSIV